MSHHNNTITDRWLPHAAGFREHIGSPLRPHENDLRLFSEIISRWQQAVITPPNALILGVTPELYSLPWSEQTEVYAIDQSAAMIRDVWPGPVNQATHANWLEMPFTAHSMGFVICDGGLHLLRYPEQQSELAARINHILAPGGLCCFRLFVPPARPETPSAVLTDLQAGLTENMNCLKLKLGMAIQPDAITGVRLGDIWSLLHHHVPDPAFIISQPGWTAANYNTVAAYENSDTSYHFASVSEVISLFESASHGRLQLESIVTPKYTMGDQCPIVTFRAR